MTWSQEQQAKAADRHQRSVEKKYKVDNKVWLLTRNIKTKQPSKKLDHKIIGFYQIKKLVGLSYQLKLPTSMKIHNVFYPSLLCKISANPLSSQHNDFALPVIVNNKEERKVNDILDAKRKRRKKIGKKVIGGKI